MSNQNKTTTIGVLSDTHLSHEEILPLQVSEELEKMDLIIHLGDFCNVKAYKELQKIAPVIAVHGNMDVPDLKMLIPEKKKIEIAGYNLGLVHGWGPPKDLDKRVAKAFSQVDIVLYGHSHTPLAATIDGVRTFNPGSVYLNRDGTKSYGVLELGETISHRIIPLD